MKFYLSKIYYFLLRLKRLNILSTIVFNLKILPFNDAMKFPFLLYGRIYFNNLSGEVVINRKDIKTGMIKIGYKYVDLVPTSNLPTQVYIAGKLIFKGNCLIGGGTSIHIEKQGLIEFGENTIFASGGLVKSLNNIKIGNNTRIAYETVIFDSNIHYVKEIITGIISKNNAPIIIGNNCWINSRSFIGKGTILPDYSIVAGSSFLNKDYSEFGSNLFLAGSPAKPTNAKVQRIFSTEIEARLNNYFNKNKNVFSYEDKEGILEDKNEFFETSFLKL